MIVQGRTTPRHTETPVRTNDGKAVVRVDGLTKRYGSVNAVTDMSFEVRQGEVFGFLGPNGSGKSTTIGMLLGLIQPTAGQIDLFGLGPDRRLEGLARVGAIIESPAFYPYLSGRDNLRVLALLRCGVTDARVNEVLDTVGLSGAADKAYRHYSLGMKQRLGIGSTLIHDPELLILDEPTNGLDPVGMSEVRHLILRLASQGKTIFVSSHLLNEVEQVCDRVVIVQRGHKLAEGRISEIVGREERLRVRTSTPQRAVEVLQAMHGVQLVEVHGHEVVVTAPDVPRSCISAALIQQGIDVQEFRMTENTLEDAFLRITGNHPVLQQN